MTYKHSRIQPILQEQLSLPAVAASPLCHCSLQAWTLHQAAPKGCEHGVLAQPTCRFYLTFYFSELQAFTSTYDMPALVTEDGNRQEWGTQGGCWKLNHLHYLGFICCVCMSTPETQSGFSQLEVEQSSLNFHLCLATPNECWWADSRVLQERKVLQLSQQHSQCVTTAGHIGIIVPWVCIRAPAPGGVKGNTLPVLLSGGCGQGNREGGCNGKNIS